jgi:hypothetical protein
MLTKGLLNEHEKEQISEEPQKSIKILSVYFRVYLSGVVIFRCQSCRSRESLLKHTTHENLFDNQTVVDQLAPISCNVASPSHNH